VDKQQPIESQRITQRLLKTKRPEEVALALRVSVNTIYRWARGVTPQPGHFTALRDYAKRKIAA
jgi:transcriptional regulator with XRE-family HTH domain